MRISVFGALLADFCGFACVGAAAVSVSVSVSLLLDLADARAGGACCRTPSERMNR